MAARRLRVVSMSRTCGMFSRMTGSSVSRAAAMQGSAGLGAGNASGQHNQRDWRTISGGGKSTAGSFAIGSGEAFEYSDGALRKLLISREDVDHEVAVDVSQASHGPCGEHIENHFVGCSGFIAR